MNCIGMRAHDLEERDIVSLSKKLSQLGIEQIQLALPKSIENIDFSVGKFSPALANYLGKELSENNVFVSVLGSYINPVLDDETAREEAISRFIEMLKYAKYMGVGMVGTETGMPSDAAKTRSEENYQRCLSVFKRLVAAAEKLGVRIGIEGVSIFTIYDCKIMKRLMDDLNSPNVGVIFDLVNLLNAENYQNQREIIDEAFSLLGDRIEVIHLKDFVVKDGTLHGCCLGEGLVDYPYLLTKIKEQKPYLPILLEEQNEAEYPRLKSLLEQYL